MSAHEVRVEVTPLQTDGMRDVLGDVIQRQIFADHGIDVGKVRSIRGYLIRSQYDASEIEPHVQDIFSDPIIEYGVTNTSLLEFYRSSTRACFTSTAFYVEAKSSWSVASLLCKIGCREEFSYLVEDFGVRSWIRTRGSTDW